MPPALGGAHLALGKTGVAARSPKKHLPRILNLRLDLHDRAARQLIQKTFKTTAVPDALQAKRAKMQAVVEKKQADADKPRQVNLGALAKKIKAQLAGNAS